MKKSLLALASLALISSAHAATVYDKDGSTLAIFGRVQSIGYSHNASSVGKNSIESSARLGFDLRTQLTDGIAGFAYAEFDMADGDNAVDSTDGGKARYLWVGTDFGQFGVVKVGKMKEAAWYVQAATDQFEDFGTTGSLGSEKREAVINYAVKLPVGFDFATSYSLAKENLTVDGAYLASENLDVDYSYTAKIGYTSPQIGVGSIGAAVGYAHAKFMDKSVNNTVQFDGNAVRYDKYNQWSANLTYGADDHGLYLAAIYQQRKFDMQSDIADALSSYKVSGYELLAGYTFDNGVQLITSYQVKEVSNLSPSKVKSETLPVIARYQINPNFLVYAEARFDLGTDKSADKNFDEVTGSDFSQNMYAVGVRYTF